MGTATELFEIIFHDDKGRRYTDRLGILGQAVRYAHRLIKSGYNGVDVRNVYRDKYVDPMLLEDIAWAKRLISETGETDERLETKT